MKKEVNLGLIVFSNGLRDRGSIPGRPIPKTQKMVHKATLLGTQHYFQIMILSE